MNSFVLAQAASDSYSVVGLLLTLVGLLATFFAVQLAQWVMSLLEVKAKWEAHEGNDSEDSKDARREARATLKGLSPWVILLVTVPLAGFVSLTIYQSFTLLSTLAETPEKNALFWSLIAFSACFGLLTLLLLVWGIAAHRRVGKKMK